MMLRLGYAPCDCIPDAFKPTTECEVLYARILPGERYRWLSLGCVGCRFW